MSETHDPQESQESQESQEQLNHPEPFVFVFMYGNEGGEVHTVTQYPSMEAAVLQCVKDAYEYKYYAYEDDPEFMEVIQKAKALLRDGKICGVATWERKGYCELYQIYDGTGKTSLECLQAAMKFASAQEAELSLPAFV